MLSVSYNAIAGLVFLCIATILCALGMVTVEWMTLEAIGTNATADADGLIAWRKGLWEECRAPIVLTGSNECTMTMLKNADVSVTLWLIRIILCVGSFFNLFAVIFTVLWLFGYRCKNSQGWRSATLLLASLAAFLNILPSLAFGLGFAATFGSQEVFMYTLGWSFYVAIIGAIFLSPANFFLCQYNHHLDDEDNLLYEKHQLRNRDDINTSYM